MKSSNPNLKYKKFKDIDVKLPLISTTFYDGTIFTSHEHDVIYENQSGRIIYGL